MKTLIDVAICLNCDTGVYLRTSGDVRSCDCGNITMEEDGTLIREGEYSYRMELNVPFKKTAEELAADFEECKDKFGLLRSAVKMVRRLRDPNRKVGFGTRRRFEDDAEGMIALEGL